MYSPVPVGGGRTASVGPHCCLVNMPNNMG